MELQAPLRHINESIEGLKEIQVIKSETFEKVNQLSERVEALLSTIDSHQKSLTQVFTQFGATAQSANQLWDSYENTFDRIQKEISDGVIKYTDVMRNNAQQLFKEYDEQLSSGLNNISQSIFGLTESFENLSDKLDELSKGAA